MARILAISSQVVRGAVGLSIVVPALQALGHEVLALPTVLLSNHPGHPKSSRIIQPPEHLSRILDALRANGWLAGIDAVLTGYLPTAAHIAVAIDAITRVRALSPAALVVCDPILGDDPKGLYIEAAAAEAIRDRLLPLADLATPNRFELAYLTGRDVDGPPSAMRARGRLPETLGLIATSLPAQTPGYLVNMLDFLGFIATTTVEMRPAAPHGTGDLLAALLTGALVDGATPPAALAAATGTVDRVLADSTNRDALSLMAVQAYGLSESWQVDTLRQPRHPG